MTRRYTFRRHFKLIAGVATVGLMLVALSYELDGATPCLCGLAAKTAGIALEGLRALCLLANVQRTVSAGLWENLEFLQILARIGKSLWPLLGVLAS